MLQAAKTELFNLLVPKAHNSEWQKFTISFTNKASKWQLRLEFADTYFWPSALMG